MITKQPPFTPTLGAIHSDSETTFRIWAPAQDAVRVVFDDDGEEHPMQVDAAGFFSGARSRRSHRPSLLVPPPAGRRPDPASRYQPDGPLGPSEVVSSHRFAWSDDDWSGAPPAYRNVVYELHIEPFAGGHMASCRTKHLAALAGLA